MAVKKRRTKRKQDQDHSDPAPNSLTGLPTELLSIIISRLAAKRDIFALACVCRRLNDVAMAQWLGPPKEYLTRYSQFCNIFLVNLQSSDPKPQLFSSFADLRLCVITKPRIPSMTLMFGKDYVKLYREFSRYIDTIPSDQKPSLHIKLYIREITYTPINVKVFNTFCARLVDYGAVTSISSFQEGFDLCTGLDVKRPGQPVFHPPTFTTLTELHLDFVSDRFADWLLRSAAISPIRELSIFPGFPTGRRIHIPTLRKLELRGRSTTTSRMIQLLSDKAHSSLSELIITGEPYWEMPVKGRMIPLRANAMPSLTSLASDFKVLINLLVTPEAFPKLEQVKVYHMGGKDSSVAKDAEELLARISPLPSVHCITFPVSALEPTDWDNLSGAGIILPNVTKLIDAQSSSSHPVILSQVRKVFPNIVDVDT